PVPASALAWPRCATYTIAARLDTRPERTYARPTLRATGMPAYRAPDAANPIAYHARPMTDRCSTIAYASTIARSIGSCAGTMPHRYPCPMRRTVGGKPE